MTDDRLVAPELVAVVVGVDGRIPRVLTTAAPGQLPRLPAGALGSQHRSMQAGVRAWVESQTSLRLGYLEQLYTFADRDRVNFTGGQVISVSYLALTVLPGGFDDSVWLDYYTFFPWEDQRSPDSRHSTELAARLRRWIDDDEPARRLRCQVTFGLDGREWLPELALQRYEILYEAGLIPESPSDTGELAADVVGPRMLHDHRRILATGLGRLRAKIQYRPVVFELMPSSFTLGQLQGCVEAIAGQGVHKQNFRRLVAQQNLVEEAGGQTADTGGRPAKLYRFRREVIDERAATGTKLPRSR